MSARLDREGLAELLACVDRRHGGPGRLYLLGETSQLYAGLRDWTTQVEVSPEDGGLTRALALVCEELRVPLVEEFPGDLIPLPEGYRERARPAGRLGGGLELLHFDPYSMAYRYIARGDEPDYHVVLVWLGAGWLAMETMDSLLQALLPRFADETIRQDPAEFRRKYKGLRQMWRAGQPRTTHRTTPA